MSIDRLAPIDVGYLDDGRIPTVYPETGFATASLTSAANNTPGAWVEVIPVNTIAVDFVIVGVVAYPALPSTRSIVELATGAGGAEVLAAGTGFYINTLVGLLHGWHMLPKPIKVGANSRVAGRRTLESTGAVTYYGTLYYPLA